MRFLLRWQRGARGAQLIGADGLGRVLEQLQGFETAAGAWEREVLPARLHGYDQSWLDQLCLAGQVVWCRLSPRRAAAGGDAGEEPEAEARAGPAPAAAAAIAGKCPAHDAGVIVTLVTRSAMLRRGATEDEPGGQGADERAA